MPQGKQQGFSLMEILVAVAIFAMISLSLYTLFTLGIKIVNEDKARIGARVVAEQKMEIIKSLAYDNVGVVGGAPAGDLLPSETITMNSVRYTVTTDIHYNDDAYDAVAPTDTVNADYKKVRIQVYWESQFATLPIVLVCDIVPSGRESAVSGGTLALSVFDSASNPISGATIQVVNDEVFPPVNLTSGTNAEGLLNLPGVAAGTQSYQISVSKAGYAAAQTYSVDPSTNPNPNPAHLSVGEAAITDKVFIIDKLADLTINAQTESGDPISGFNFTLQGDEAIGTDGDGQAIAKYSADQTTDPEGKVVLEDLEPQIFDLIFTPSAVGYDLAGYSPSLPYQLAPDTQGEITITLSPHTANSLLLTVTDGAGNVQNEATVQLSNALLLYDQTKTTNTDGQVFFSALESALYNLSISKTGYENFNLEVNINAQTNQQISLTTVE